MTHPASPGSPTPAADDQPLCAAFSRCCGGLLHRCCQGMGQRLAQKMSGCLHRCDIIGQTRALLGQNRELRWGAMALAAILGAICLYIAITWAVQLVWIVLKIALILAPIMGAVAYITFAERKVIGYMQSRLGPNRVGPKGWLQPVADSLKLLFKEIIIPTGADRVLFLLAPVISIGTALAAWAVVPFDSHLVLADVNAGLLYILALSSLAVYGVIIAGWASNSKYAFLGAMRSAAQMISYEIAMGFALVTVLMAAGSLNLGDIVRAQEGGLFHWFWIPLFPMFVVYFISGLAETNRAPFDLPEGESELVAGFHVDYSGMAFAAFFLAEYANMILISALSSILFLGGWQSPFKGFPRLDGWFTWVPDIGWLILKICSFIFLFLWIRATFPRYRYDQIMRLGWKVFLPLTIVWIVVTGGLVMLGVPPWFD